MAGTGHSYVHCAEVQVLQTPTSSYGKTDVTSRRRRVQRMSCHTILLCALIFVTLLSFSLILYFFYGRLQSLEAQLASTELRLRELNSSFQQYMFETTREESDDEDYYDDNDDNDMYSQPEALASEQRQKRAVPPHVSAARKQFGKPRTKIGVLHLRAFDPYQATTLSPTQSSSYMDYSNQRQLIGDGSQFGRLSHGRVSYYGKQVMHWQSFNHPIDTDKFMLLPDGNVQVLRKGWYAIFAHVTFESSSVLLQASILHNGVHKLAAGTQQLQKDIDHTETITVSTTQFLHPNDTISVSLFLPNMTVSLRGADTQFNIIKLT